MTGYDRGGYCCTGPDDKGLHTVWAEAFKAGKAPPVVPEAGHVYGLEFVSLEDLKAHTD